MDKSSTKPSITRILHVTDLHLGSSYSNDQNTILSGMLGDLKQLQQTAVSPEFMCFTGDIVYSGNQESFSRSFETLLEIAYAAGISSENIIIAPGNHDADTAAVASGMRNLPDLRKTAAQNPSGDFLSSDNSAKTYLASVFEPFKELCETFEQEINRYSNWPYYSVSNFDAVTFISLNTALLTGTGLPGVDDENQLIFPENQIAQALEKAQEGNQIVFLGHHPLSWLTQPNQNRVESLIAKRGAAYLYGHVHEAKPSKKVFSSGTIFANQGGAIYQGRDKDIWAGYSFLLLERLQTEWFVKTRRWYEARRDFDDAVELSAKGEFSTNHRLWSSILPSLDIKQLEKWRVAQLVPHLKEVCCDTVVGRDIDDVFVAPDFDHETPISKETDAKFGPQFKVLKFESLIDSQVSTLIESPPETGKTSVLNRLTLDIARKPIIDDNWTIPARIDFGAFKPSVKEIATSIRRNLPTLPEHCKTEALLEEGRFTVIIDDVDFRDKKRQQALSDFIKKYPTCRYILATSNTLYSSAGMRPEISEGHDSITLKMRPLKASSLTALIEKAAPRDGIAADQLRERLVREAELLNVPLTAVTSTFLIQILSTDVAEKPLNQAGLIERYLDLLLEKYTSPELNLGTFNYRNKVDLLSAIAANMIDCDEYHPDENYLVAFIADYLKAYGLEYSAANIFRHLVTARVLVVRAGQVSFRLKMFFEYFVAYRMQTETSFKEFIFDDERYPAYPNEIALYCALNLKDDQKLLEILATFRALTQKCWGDKAPEEIGGIALDNFQLPSASATNEELDEFILASRSNKDIADARKEASEDIELPDDRSQEIERHLPKDDIGKWISHLLLLGGMLKHLELISNETKIQVLNELLDGWLQFTNWSMASMVELAKNRKLVINGVTYRSNFPDSMSAGQVARQLAVSMPVAAARMASLTLGTEKLSGQLRTGIDDECEPKSKHLLRYSLLIDLVPEEITNLGSNVLKSVQSSDFLSRSFALKLREIAIRYRLPEKTIDKVRQLTADAATGSMPGSKRTKTESRNKLIETIKRERLLVSYQTKD